jgi:hypothetical protein
MPKDHHSLHPHDLHITADPRIELLAVVQYLGGYGQRFPLLTSFDIQYKTEIEEAFRSFCDHQAVKEFDQMSVDGFHADAPPGVMLHLSAPPELDVQVSFTDYLIERAGSPDRLGQFIAALRDFANASHFMNFYQAHSAFYEAIVKETAALLSGDHDLAVLENYYGMKQHSYTLILAPLFSSGGYGPRIYRENDLFDIYSITGPSEMNAQNQPTFRGSENLRFLIWHEFAHSFVNPLTERYLREVNQYQALYQMNEEQMKNYGYSNWEITVNEHIVRAVTVRMAARELGEAEGRASLEQELEWGFAYTDLLVERLKRYEEQRDRFPAFRDYYPELIKGFAEAEPVQSSKV